MTDQGDPAMAPPPYPGTDACAPQAPPAEYKGNSYTINSTPRGYFSPKLYVDVPAKP